MLGVSAVTLTRKAAGAQTYVDGVPITKSVSTSLISASVQSATAQMLEQLTEGERKRNPKLIISEVELKLDDTIAYSGDDYLVKELFDNNQPGMLLTAHYKAMMLKVKE